MRWYAFPLLLGCPGLDPKDCDSGGCDSGTDPSVIRVNNYIGMTGDRPKNVIFFTYDTLRRDHVNAMGYTERTTTPVLDRLFTEGVGFYDHRSCSSWTFPSFTCVLTGRDQIDNEFWPYAEISIDGQNLPEVPEDFPLLARIFQDMGYYTGVYAASGFLGQAAGMDAGMDEGWGQFGSRLPAEDEEMKSDEVLDYAIEFLDDRLSDRETPFFLHLHFIDPHMPWTPPEEFQAWERELEPLDTDYFSNSLLTSALWGDIKDGDFSNAEVSLLVEHMLARYDGEIAYADTQTERFLDYLETHGLFEDTIVVFTTDHGEEFYDHGNFNHGYNSYDEQIRSVAAFYQPGNLLPARVEEMTQHQDLVPTLFAILGSHPSESPYYKGFTGLVVGTDEPREWASNLVYRWDGDPEHQNRTHQAVTDGKQKLMFRWDDDARAEENGGPNYFYEITADPGEEDNVFSADDLTQAGWWEKLCPFIEVLEDAQPGVVPATDPQCPE